jgi:xanthine dehydrogenase accessory factor
MNGSNRFVIQQLTAWLDQGLQPWLATVIKTYGSSPRPIGSMMIYHPDKGVIGSLSGGCIEQELMRQLANPSSSEAMVCPAVIRYGESPEEQSRLALPCGGHLDILLEKITPAGKEHFSIIESALDSRSWISREVDLATGQIKTLYHPVAKLTDESSDKSKAKEEFGNSKNLDIRRTDYSIIHSLKPHDKLLLVGAGEVARCLAEITKHLDFEITLCDFRDEFLQGWQVEGVTVIKAMPDELIADAFNDNHCAIVALAHDPRVDDMAMMQALKTNAFYIGAMGSLVTSNNRRQRLLELELTSAQIEKLHAPIGLNIHSRTPYEIAISIAAQLVQQRSIR